MTYTKVSDPTTAIPRVNIHPAFVGLLLVLVCAPLFFLNLNTYPTPWYDEGYTTQVSRLLLDEGVYGTYNATEGYRLFDPTISSGPTIVVPVALSFKLLGLGLWQARLIIVFYALVALYGCYICMSYIFDSKSALLGVGFLLIMPLFSLTTAVSFIHTGRQVLGEVPALAFVIFALYLWFRSWDRKSWLLSIVAGLLLGLAVLSKPQIAIGLFPGIGLIVLARSVKNWRSIFHNASTVVVGGLVFVAWTLIQRSGMTEQVRQESSGLMLEAIRLHFFTGLYGSNLSTTALGLTGIMVLTALITFWSVIMRARKTQMTSVLWAEATLASIILCTAIWFAVFSVGFERYAFIGITLSLLLLGNIAYTLLVRVVQMVAPRTESVIVTVISILLLTLVLGLNAFNLSRNIPAEDDIQNAVTFINRTIPDYAVVESMELELTSVAAKRQYHHANYLYMYDAIQQRSHDNVPFNLGYDVLQVNPDFLITGGMAEWLNLYDPTVVDDNFRELARFGTYRILQRVRKSSEE